MRPGSRYTDSYYGMWSLYLCYFFNASRQRHSVLLTRGYRTVDNHKIAKAVTILDHTLNHCNFTNELTLTYMDRF